MGYYLQAVIAKHSLLKDHVSEFNNAVIVPLALGMALIPVTDELFDEVGEGGEDDGFFKLSPEMADWIRKISLRGPVAYVEADFFGGIGGQSAKVWSTDRIIMTVVNSADAINQALRLLAVLPGKARDEFEAIGLNRHRDTHDWIADAS